ncbi:hypothetical protein BU15DRAFT_73360 [Melanogaster broomeanus]|nr:hypothetical protein BU15DRAFT_73360 [Melanogaster broomeanus]
MSSPFAALPSELILSVISCAAEHHPTALALSLVSSWVHKHVEPALYHTVRLRSSRTLASFIYSLDNKPHTFAAAAVKKLCITALGPISSIENVLSRCTGVNSLACGFSVPSYVHCPRSVPGSSLDVPEHNALRHLPITPKEQHMLALACRDGLDMTVISPAVSHLRIQLTSSITPESIARLSDLRQLTHLAVDMLRPVIEEGRLRVLVLQVAGAGPAGDVHLEEITEVERERGNAEKVDATTHV